MPMRPRSKSCLRTSLRNSPFSSISRTWGPICSRAKRRTVSRNMRSSSFKSVNGATDKRISLLASFWYACGEPVFSLSSQNRLLARAALKMLRVWAAVCVLLAPLAGDLLPKAQGGMSCCRTKKASCCRRGMKPGDAKPAFQAAASCERTCAGMVAGSAKTAAPVRHAGLQSAPPVRVSRDAQLRLVLPHPPALSDLHPRPPPFFS